MDTSAGVPGPLSDSSLLPIQTAEPAAHLPGPGEIGGKQLPAAPAEPEEQGWSREPDPDGFGTLAHQSESQADTKTDPSESVSVIESLPGDLAWGLHPAPSSPSVDRVACWECPDGPATTPPQEYHSTGVPEPDTQEERDLSLEFKPQSYENGSQAFAAVPGEEETGPLRGWVASQERGSLLAEDPHRIEGCLQGATGSDSLQQAKVVIVQELGGFSVISLQSSRSESCLCVPEVWPFLLCCCELNWSWPHIHDRARGPGLPLRCPLDRTTPWGPRAKKRSAPGPAVNLALSYSQPCFEAPSQLPFGTSCLLHTTLCHSTRENIDDKGREFPGHHCPHKRTLTRAHSISGFPLRYPDDQPGQSSVKFGSPLKERTDVERNARTQKPLHPAVTKVSPVHSAPQRMAPYLQGKDSPSALSCRRASQDMPSENQLENQLGQDSRSCLGSSCHAAEPMSLCTEEVPVPVVCKSEHGPESSPEGPPGTGPAPDAATVIDKQMHLQDISVEAGNQSSNYTVKYILTEKREPPARAKFPHRPGNSGSQVQKGDGTGFYRASDRSDTPETTPKSSATDTSKKAEHAMVPDPNCTEDAPQGISEVPSAALCHRSCGYAECGRQREGVATGALPPREPKADASSRGKCTLVIVAVEQKGLQAARRVGPLLESQSCEFLEGRPGSPRRAGATPCGFPMAGRPHACGRESELPAAPRQGGGDGALGQAAHAADRGAVLVPHAASGREEACSPEPAGSALSTQRSAEGTGPGADEQHAAPGTSPGPQVPGGAPEGGPAPASARAPALLPPRWPQRLSQASRQPGKRLMFPKVTTFRKSPLAAAQTCAAAARQQGEPDCDHVLAGPAPDVAGSTHTGSKETPGHDHVHAGPAPDVTLWAVEREHAGGEETPGRDHVLVGPAPDVAGGEETPDLVGSRPSSDSCEARRLRPPEKRLRARLALAHRTLAGFFEAKGSDREDPAGSAPASARGLKEKGGLLQGPWRALLRGRGAEGPRRPFPAGPEPEPEVLPALDPSPPGTQGRLRERARGPESCTPAPARVPVSPGTLAPPGSRRRSDPAILCSSPGASPVKPVSPASPRARRSGASHALPPSAARGSAAGRPRVPRKPVSPKPQGPRPGALQANCRHPGLGSAVSMVFLGSYSDDSNADGRPGTLEPPKPRTGLLLSLQALDRDGLQEDSGERSTAAALRDLLGRQVSYRDPHRPLRPS